MNCQEFNKDIKDSLRQINTVFDHANRDVTETIQAIDKILHTDQKPVLIGDLPRHVETILESIQSYRAISFAFVTVHCCSSLLRWKQYSPFNLSIFVTETDGNGYRFYFHANEHPSSDCPSIGFGIEHRDGLGVKANIPLTDTQAFLVKLEEMVAWFYQQIQIRRLPEFIQADTVAEIVNRLHAMDQRYSDNWKEVGQKCLLMVNEVLDGTELP